MTDHALPVTRPPEPWRQRLIRTLLYGAQRRSFGEGARACGPRDHRVCRRLYGDRGAAS